MAANADHYLDDLSHQMKLEQQEKDAQKTVRDPENYRPGAVGCGDCGYIKCACDEKEEEEDMESPLQTAEDEGRTEDLILEAGETSLSDRVANLITEGQPYDAIARLESALNNADDKTISEVAKTALHAYELMSHYGYDEQANILGTILSDYGLDVNEIVPEPSVTQPSPSESPAQSAAPAPAPSGLGMAA